jgi:hypothetical protein
MGNINWIKENWFKVLLILTILLFVFIKDSGINYLKNPFKDSYTYSNPLSEDIFVCRFDVISDFFKDESSIDSESSKIRFKVEKQKSPIQLTFANLSGANPIMKGNGGDAPITVLKNDNEMMLLVETNAFGDMFLYTIFKKQKVATWQKSYLLLDSPYAMVSMGYCN